ncbi:MAG: S-layer homology domain-containing protein [Oscillospiraceae bacterium]|jgi:hypothetical protein|nr:S-layer homology domain-containing protein [Oscillospiraceae bacterium]
MSTKKLLSPILALILAIILAIPLFTVPVSAADQTEVENTIRALGIMVGDEKGNMKLADKITRAEFVKLAVNASVYKDTAADSSGYSLFRDVKSSHWASPSVKIAVDNGWVTGYSDGTFRPDKTITLEEAATLALRMLGYTQADLVGVFPDAQLAKYRSLGLDKNVPATRGAEITRRDCMNIFYNMLTSDTKQGTPYATTLGYKLDAAGEVNYTALINAGIEGPTVLSRGSALASSLPFPPENITVYRNGSVSTLSAAQAYDVCYYHKNLRTVWLYSKRVTGALTAVLPGASDPTGVTVAGASYTIATSSAARAVSDLGEFKSGDRVTLLLGRDDAVCAVLSAETVNDIIYGVVSAVGKSSYTDAEGKTVLYDVATVIGTDGAPREYSIGGTIDPGTIVSAGYTGNKSEITRLGEKSIAGRVSDDGKKLGDYNIAPGAEILDTSASGAAAVVTPERLAGVFLSYGDVRFYALDANGDIYRMVLRDVTGDQYTYGIITSATEVSDGAFQISSSYSYIINGKPGAYSSQNSAFGVNQGGAVFYYGKNGNVERIRNIRGVDITSVSGLWAEADGKRTEIAPGAQIYVYSKGEYTPVSVESISGEEYNVYGYIDNNGFVAGGRIRILVATKK